MRTSLSKTDTDSVEGYPNPTCYPGCARPDSSMCLLSCVAGLAQGGYVVGFSTRTNKNCNRERFLVLSGAPLRPPLLGRASNRWATLLAPVCFLMKQYTSYLMTATAKMGCSN